MIITTTDSAFDGLGISNQSLDRLKSEQRTATEDYARGLLSQWWLSNVSNTPLPSGFQKSDAQDQIDDLLVTAETLLTNTVDGWQAIFNNQQSGFANIIVADSKKIMTGSSSGGEVNFELKGAGLSLGATSYKITSIKFSYRAPESPIKIQVEILGNIDVIEGLITKSSFVLNSVDVDLGGFIKESFTGKITYETKKQSQGNFDYWHISTKKLSLSLDIDPSNSEALTLEIAGDFYSLVDKAHSWGAIEPIETLDSVSLTMGKLKLSLQKLNIKSNSTQGFADAAIKKAVYASLKKTGIDLGFDIELGNGLEVKLENSKFVQSKSNPDIYSVVGASLSASIDTRVGDEIRQLVMKAVFDTTFNLATGKVVKSYVNSVELSADDAETFGYAVNFAVSDIKVDTRNLQRLDTNSVEGLFTSLRQYDEKNSKTFTLNYDSGVDMSAESLEGLLDFSLTSQIGANIIGNVNGNKIRGNSGADTISGMSGSDTIWGGGGDDFLSGGMGADTIEGGAGADIFEFGNIFDSTTNSPDTITDFNFAAGDRIDLTSIAHDVQSAGGMMVYSGLPAVTAIGSKALKYGVWFKSGKLYIDVSGDGKQDMVINLTGVKSLDKEAVDL